MYIEESKKQKRMFVRVYLILEMRKYNQLKKVLFYKLIGEKKKGVLHVNPLFRPTEDCI